MWDNEDIKAISDVIRRGMDWAIGPEIEEFENALAKYVGTEYCLTFNSGTSAGHAALIAIGIKPNDEIVLPSFTFIATANWPLMVKASPKFVDIEEETLGLDPLLVENAIKKNTKAVIPVHYGGLPSSIEEITQITKKKRIYLIEDAAESLGASVKKKKVGTFGDLAILSFAGNKVLTTGEGGAILTNSKKLFEKLKLIRSHGRSINQNYFSSNEIPHYTELGYNWRMSSMTAALGLSQLTKFEKLISLRRKNAKYLSDRLSKFHEIKVPNEPQNYRHVYQLYSIRLSNPSTRKKLQLFLTKRRIMSKIFFQPVHLTNFYKKSVYGTQNKLPMTERIFGEILTLPMYPTLKKEELDLICDTIGEFIESKDNKNLIKTSP